MTREQKIKKIITKSKKIFRDNSLENGAITAANSEKDYYPREARNYHYVWPRDASYICVAAKMAGVKNIQKPFFDWLYERPEDFKKDGLLFANYSTNGRVKNHGFQPDQMGSVLWAIHDFYKEDLNKAKKYEQLIRMLADGLTKNWQGAYFFTNTVDLWEEWHRKTSTRIRNNHTYSLAACSHGLKLAYEMLEEKKWLKASDQMKEKIEDAYHKKNKYYLRNHGKVEDYNIDSSLLGLVYPTEMAKPNSIKMANTVSRMEKNIVFHDGGVHRYQFDYYDGEGSGQEGAGAWPLLNFWMAIYWSAKGNKKKALFYYNWVIDRLDDDLLIPEQIFDDFRQGIKPLAWSHAMFIIASKYLGHLK